MIEIPQDLWKRIVAYVETDYKYEHCGIMGGNPKTRVVSQVTYAGNVVQENKERRYVMNPVDIIQAEKKFAEKGLENLGYYHSHPDHPAAPSETDRVNAWPGYSYVILSVMKGKVAKATSWVLNEKTEQFEEEKLEVIARSVSDEAIS